MGRKEEWGPEVVVGREAMPLRSKLNKKKRGGENKRGKRLK